jgi:V-type H+-transporting ATPase subunit a
MKVLHQTEEHRFRVLADAASRLRVWIIKVRKMKAIYHTLNMFSGGSGPVGPATGGQNSSALGPKSLIGECWCPVKQLDRIHIALRRGTVSVL